MRGDCHKWKSTSRCRCFKQGVTTYCTISNEDAVCALYHELVFEREDMFLQEN